MGEADNSAVFEIPEDRAHDPREQEGGFLRLPEDAKDELRDGWRFTERLRAEVKSRRKRTVRVYMVESVILLAVLTVFTPQAIPLAAVIGVGCGWLGWKLRAGTLIYGWVGALGYALVMALTGVLNLFAFALAAFGFGLLGMIHQLQRADRTEL